MNNKPIARFHRTMRRAEKAFAHGKRFSVKKLPVLLSLQRQVGGWDVMPTNMTEARSLLYAIVACELPWSAASRKVPK